jgi:hypothetical protein
VFCQPFVPYENLLVILNLNTSWEQFNKIPSGKNPSAEALLSDKWMYAKAILTPQAIEEFEK